MTKGLVAVASILSLFMISGCERDSSTEAETATDDTVVTDTDTEKDNSPVVDEKHGGKWVRHVINEDIGGSIMFSFIPNLCGDGALKAIGSNHTNTMDDPDDPESQIVLFDVPSDPKELRNPWPMTKISEGIVSRESKGVSYQGAPGIFGWGDADMDGDLDLVVSGDGDAKIYVLEQTEPCQFTTRVLAEEMGQAGFMLILDIDKDGTNELIVSSYEANIVLAYEWSHPASTNYDDYAANFEVHTISERNSPIVAAHGDLNADGHLDLVVSHYSPADDYDMKGELVILEGTGDLESWNPVVLNENIQFPHMSVIKDIDQDGDLDVFHPSGFLACEANPFYGKPCGAIGWYENTGSEWTKHQFYGPESELFFWGTVIDDFDGDGFDDFVTVGERKPIGSPMVANVLMFKGIEDEPYFSNKPISIGEGLGGLIQAKDIDNDGDVDLFSSEFFLPDTYEKFSFAWLEQIKAPEPN